MTARTRLAVLFVMGCLLTAAWLLLHTDAAHARPPVPASLFRAVRAEWRTQAERIHAFDVAWCESRYSTRARNGQYLGLFQLGAWARSRYGHAPTVRGQTHAAHALYRDFGWSQWVCA